MDSECLLNMTKELGQILSERNELLVTAESCSGGGLAEMVTRVPGSSAWFERGYVTYSNLAKNECLGVPIATLHNMGPVSEAVALQMALGALHNSHAELAVAITGIAGPDGALPDKPVGSVYLAWAHQQGIQRSQYVLCGKEREEVRQHACMIALQGCIDLFQYLPQA